MSTLTIDTKEGDLLHEILEAHLAQLRVEIGRADSLDFKHQLLERYRVVEGIFHRVVGAGTRPSAPIL